MEICDGCKKERHSMNEVGWRRVEYDAEVSWPGDSDGNPGPLLFCSWKCIRDCAENRLHEKDELRIARAKSSGLNA